MLALARTRRFPRGALALLSSGYSVSTKYLIGLNEHHCYRSDDKVQFASTRGSFNQTNTRNGPCFHQGLPHWSKIPRSLLPPDRRSLKGPPAPSSPALVDGWVGPLRGTSLRSSSLAIERCMEAPSQETEANSEYTDTGPC